MSVLISLTILFICSIVFFYFYKKEKRNKNLFPQQLELVVELITDLRKSKIDIILSRKGVDDSALILNLLEVKDFIENRRELSHEKYEDYKLFFTDESYQILDFRKYIHNRFLPKDIHEELKHFYNTHFVKTEPEGPYFIIITEPGQENQVSEGSNSGPLSGNGDAVESWLVFREHAANLHFEIDQWIRENANLRDEKILEFLDELN